MNDLPVVRSPWRILILVLGFTFLLRPDADAGDLLVQQLEAGNGLGRDGRRAGIANCSTMMR